MTDYRTEAPQILRDFLSYHETIKAHSRRTVDEYFLDLRNFFRYLKRVRNPALADLDLDEIDIMDVDLEFVSSVTLTDIYGYMTYLTRDRAQHPNSRNSDYGLNAASRARKIATIRSFIITSPTRCTYFVKILSKISIPPNCAKPCRNT